MGSTTRPDLPGTYAPPAPAATEPPPDAVVFVPSLFPATVRNASDAARRIAAALDRNAGTRSAQFFAAEGRDESYVAGARGAPTGEWGRKATRVVSVMRRDAGGGEPVRVLDVYDFQYNASLTGAFSSRTPFLQALSVAAVLLGNFGRLLRSFGARSKDWAHKLQVAWGGALFLIMFVYMVYLVATAVASVWGGAQQLSGEASASPRWLSMMQASASVLVALGLFSRASLKAVVEKVATGVACATSYVSAGTYQKTILGELARLLEHIAEKGGAGDEPPYRRVHVVAFSFGSVIALDALFQDGEPAPAFGRVDSLVTIGCPFDFVRTYFPRYFDGRRAASSTLRWLNLYAPADVFGSDFVDVHADRHRKPRGIGLAGPSEVPEAIPESQVFGPARGLDEYGVGAVLSLTGFKIHASYWDADPDGLTCFDPIVRKLLVGTAALR